MFAKGFLTGIQFVLAVETTIAAALLSIYLVVHWFRLQYGKKGTNKKMLKNRVSEARAIINHQASKNDVRIPMLRASIFRCFLSMLEYDIGLTTDDLGANRVWDDWLQEGQAATMFGEETPEE